MSATAAEVARLLPGFLTAQALANGAAGLPDVNQVLETRATPSNPFFAGPR